MWYTTNKTNNIDNKSSIKDFSSLQTQTKTTTTVAMLISFILFPGFMALGEPIGEIIFASKRAGYYISRAAFIMIPAGLSQITSSILNAVGLEMKSLKNYIAGALLLVFCIYFMPKYMGTDALILGMTCLYVVPTILNFCMMKKRDIYPEGILKKLGILVACSLPVSLITKFLYNIFIHVFSMFISCALAGIFSCLGLFILTLVFDVIKLDAILPKRFKKYSQAKS